MSLSLINELQFAMTYVNVQIKSVYHNYSDQPPRHLETKVKYTKPYNRKFAFFCFKDTYLNNDIDAWGG